jgi:hypothetical protein
MANLIKIKRGFTAGVEPTGLTLGELAANLGDGKLYIGGTHGNSIVIGTGSSSGVANVVLASSSVTGVASFNINDFVVSTTGHVGLTSQIVRSVNSTKPDANGNVVISGLPSSVVLPLATSSITGVASFNSSYFSVNGSGQVSLSTPYQVTGDTVVQSTGVSVVRAGNAVTLSNTGVLSFNGSVGSVNFTLPLATRSTTGVAAYGNDFNVSPTGVITLTADVVRSVNGSTGAITGVAKTDTAQTFIGLQSFSYGISSSNLYVAQGATFNTIVANSVVASNLVTSFNGATGAVTYTPPVTSVPIATASLTGVASFNPIYFSTGTTGHINPTAALLTSGKINVSPTTLDDGSGTNASNFIMSRGLQTTKMDGIQTSTSGLTTTTQQVFTTRPFYSSVGSTAAVTIFGPGLTAESISYGMVNGVPTAISALTYAPIGAADVTLHLRRVSSGSLVGTELIRMSILSACDGTTNGTQYTESRIASGLQVATVAIVPVGNDFKLTVTPVSGTDSTIIAANSTIYAGSLSIA